ncbi:MAG: NPCBM/NEW2 domain-containing protein [Planctomycetales bacterium]|nr:NPCBM/NEW2 domain-containing protein [Planctomycetales bacterium]
MATLLASAIVVEATPLAGDKVQGELAGISAESLQIATADGVRQLPLTGLKSVSIAGATPSSQSGEIAVELIDGSQLRVERYQVAKGEVTVGAGDMSLTGPANTVKWVRFRSLEKEPAIQQGWDQLLQREFAGDCLAFTKEVDGALVLERLEGAVGAIDDQVVEFTYQGDTLRPKRERVLGLIYLVAKRDIGATVGSVLLKDGSTLAASSLELAGDKLRVTTGSGWTAELPADRLLGLDFGSSNITYLSDLKPTTVEVEPYYGATLDSERQTYLPRMDEDHHGAPLKLVDQAPALKGLALRSRTKLVYRFDKPYKRLRAMAGIAEHVRNSVVSPHLVLSISSDRKKLLERDVTGDDAPFEIDLDLEGVQRLTIVVDYGKSQDVADFLQLCNARLTK